MAGSIRICLIADSFLEDFAQCVASIRAHTQTPISIFASGKETQKVETLFPNESVTWQKNKLGWGHSVNHFLNSVSEKYVVIMDPRPTSRAMQSLRCFRNWMRDIRAWDGAVD